MTLHLQTSAPRRRRRPAWQWSLLLLLSCAGLSGCQRPGQRLPEPPIFYQRAAPPPARATPPPPPIPEVPEIQPFAGSTVIYFDGDSTQLDAAARVILDRQAEWLLRHPSVTAILGGHADLLGSRARQFAIGEMRAASMRRYLVARGVSPARLQITSFGKQLPVTTARDEESQRRNRRGETIFRGIVGLSEP